MECRKAEEMVNKYIERTLSLREMELFLDHVEKCSSCYDELETYYIVHETMAQLNDNGTDTALDMQNMLRQDLWNSRSYLRKIKAIKGIGLCGCMMAAGALISMIVYGILQLIHYI